MINIDGGRNLWLNLLFHNKIVQLLQFLVKHGEKLRKSVDEKGNSPLHIASERGNLEAVKIFLDHGASGDAQNHKLETPMHLAAQKGLEL